MRAWVVARNEQPLECVELPDPVPAGCEVLLDVTRCGVFHSDLHFWHGSYNLGGGRVMIIRDRGVTLPQTPGDEITGRVVAMGPYAQGIRVGDDRICDGVAAKGYEGFALSRQAAVHQAK